MRNNPTPPRLTKLRSSCDGCGAAKLKCDRSQPQCGRCCSLGMHCVYSVSRKMGKPPRGRLQNLTQPTIGNKSCVQDSCNSGIGTSADPAFSPSVQKMPAWTTAYPNSPLDAGDVTINMQGVSSLFDFTTFDFADDRLFSPEPPVKNLQLATDETPYFDGEQIISTSSRDHDCYREAHEIFGSLSFQNMHPILATPGSSTNPYASLSKCVPLDQILSVNRKSSDQLSHLLRCPCAQSPHLVLLYASIISRILVLYEQAVRQNSLTPEYKTEPLICPPMSWSSTPLDMGDNYTPLAGGSALTVAPTQMAMGSFDIDDQMQAVLQIQLVLSEIRRMGAVVDLFASRTSTSEDSSFSGVSSLYKTLSAWLRKDHTRAAEMMCSRLKHMINE